MKTWLLKVNRTLFELETGILLFGVLCQLPVFFVQDKAGYSIGLWAGVATAAIAAFHMWRSLDLGLSLGEKAPGYLGRQNILRYLLIVTVITLLAVTGAGNPLSAFLGVMGLKISAYCNPLLKHISKLLYGEEVLPDLTEEPAAEQE